MDKYKKFYEEQLKAAKEQHLQNAQRIRTGIHVLFIVPIIFMLLMFLTGANKAVFLVLFIASVFAIAIYLIYVEYKDYELQEKILMREESMKEADSLMMMNLERVGGVVSNIIGDMDK